MASRLPWESSIGSVFHSLQATSQALQPMHTEVSVKKPTRSGWVGSYPASPWTSGSGPNNRFFRPVRPGLAELTLVMPVPSPFRRSSRVLRCPAAHGDVSGLDAGAPAVSLHELHQFLAPRTPSGPDVAGGRLALLDVRVRIEHDAQEVVAGVTGGDAGLAPVVR